MDEAAAAVATVLWVRQSNKALPPHPQPRLSRGMWEIGLGGGGGVETQP